MLFTIFNGADTLEFIGTNAVSGSTNGTLYGTLYEFAGNTVSGSPFATTTASYVSLIPPDVRDFAYTGTLGTATPEPGSLALLGTGLLGVAGAARRRLVR